jgi:hypothetical protein
VVGDRDLVGSQEEPMNEQRKIVDEHEARRCLAAAQVAGGDLARWARENGISGRSLNAWRLNLARRGTTLVRPAARSSTVLAVGPGAALVELIPVPKPAAASRYAVRLGDACVEFGDDFDPCTLRRVLEVLRAC